MLFCMLNYMCRGVFGLSQSHQWCSSVGCKSFSSGIPVWGAFNLVSPVAFQCGAVFTKFFQWCSSVPCKYSLGRPVISQCTLGHPVAFQCHSSVHWTSQCILAQSNGFLSSHYNFSWVKRSSQRANADGNKSYSCNCKSTPIMIWWQFNHIYAMWLHSSMKWFH